MRNKYWYIPFLIFVIILFSVGGCILFKKEAVRIACIGDNITYGHGIQNRELNCYPAQLEKILGDRFDVDNFGVSGSTLLKSGDISYWAQEEHDKALSFDPDIVIIMLGSNDSKPWNWEDSEHYTQDYITLINEFKALKNEPKILICNPLPAYSSRWGISDSIIKVAIVPEITAIAASEEVQLIDFYKSFSNRNELFPDSIHPDSIGASLIAEQIANIIQSK